jgi:hypothetical protein
MAERGRAEGRGGYVGTWPQPGAAQAGGLAPRRVSRRVAGAHRKIAGTGRGRGQRQPADAVSAERSLVSLLEKRRGREQGATPREMSEVLCKRPL